MCSLDFHYRREQQSSEGRIKLVREVSAAATCFFQLSFEWSCFNTPICLVRVSLDLQALLDLVLSPCVAKKTPTQQTEKKGVIFGGFQFGTKPHELKNLFHTGLRRTIVLGTEH